MTVRIIGTGSYVPERIVTNDDLAQLVDTNDAWIRERTGIRCRRVTERGTAAMAVEAARNALEDAGTSPGEIDLIVVGTSTGDFLFPAAACQVQAALRADRAACFDLSAACSGFLFSLNTAKLYLEQGGYKKALVIGADTLSKTVDWSDRSTCILFGDGAGAAVLQAEEGEEEGIGSFVMGADGSRGHVLTCPSTELNNMFTEGTGMPAYMKMDGQEVFRFAVKTVPEVIEEVLEKENWQAERIQYFILHQANRRIIEAAARRMRQPMEKFPMNLERYGNTSGASIPLLLDEMNREGRLERGDQLVLAGFGAGLTWGATALTW